MPNAPANLMVNVVDGTRQPYTKKLLIRIIDGNQKERSADFYTGPFVWFRDLPVFDNFGDNYTVLVSADDYLDAGITPVHIKRGVTQTVNLMLLPRVSSFNFARATWAQLPRTFPKLYELVTNDLGAGDAARRRYEDLIETPARQPVLACLLNVTSAMSTIDLPTGKVLDYFKRLIWDDTMQQDRFYAWADEKLLARTQEAVEHGIFKPELGFQFFHKNATASYKQVQFGEANIQLSFHGNDAPPPDLPGTIKMEPDMDYFQDVGAHALLEVLPNGIEKLAGTGGLSDPKAVYVLRWIAGRRAGVPEFDPLYTIEPA